MRKVHLFFGIGLFGLMLSGCGDNAPVVESVSTPVSVETPVKEIKEEEQESKQEEEVSFVFTRDNYPVVDGSTSLRPLALNMTSVLLGEEKERVDELLIFHTTDEAYWYLMSGESDILVAAQGCKEVMDYYEEEGFEYESEAIAMEALVFVVNKDNPVDSLTSEQVKKIYSGEITNWSEVGGEDLDIVAFQRTETSGSQVMMRECVMTDCELSEAPTELMPASMGGLIDGVATYNNEANAIGYTVYYYADSMKMADGLKIIKIDDIEPCNETIGSGEYPFRNPYFCIIAKSAEENSPERIMYNWLASEQGQLLVAKSGYVPIKKVADPENVDRVLTPKENKYTRLKNDYIGKYVAGTSTGYIYPYLISSAETHPNDMYMFPIEVNRFGFVDETGMIVSDYGYSNVAFSDGYWRVTDYYGENYCISFDGKVVIPVTTWRWMDQHEIKENIFFTDDYIYKYSNKRPPNPDELYVEIIETKFDRNGNVLSEREVVFDTSIIAGQCGVQSCEEFYALVEDLYLGRYLEILSGDGDWGCCYHLLDLETGNIVIRDMDTIIPVNNGTFICEAEYSEPHAYVLYDNQGNKVSDTEFTELMYVGDNHYIAREGKNQTITVYRYDGGELVSEMTMKSESFYAKDGFFISRESERDEFTYYNIDGSLVDLEENYKAKIFDNGRKLGYVDTEEYKYVWNGGLHVVETYLEDPVKNVEDEPMFYSGYYYHPETESNDNFIYNLFTKEQIVLSKDRDSFIGDPCIINGILCVDNELRNLKTGETIFSYNPFIWDNIE